MYTVIYSSNPYLLARMATDLQMEGMIANVPHEWNDPWDSMFRIEPTEDSQRRQMDLFIQGNEFCFYGTGTQGENLIGATLTSRNYLKVLGAILNCKK